MPQQSDPRTDPSWYRADGTKKGDGFLGVLQRPDGKVSSEISIGVNIDGKEVEIPTMVPTLSEQEKHWLLTNDVEGHPEKIPASIQRKAVDFARTRLAAGKSPFAQAGEGPKTMPDQALTDAQIAALAKELPPDQYGSVLGMMTPEEQTKFRSATPKYMSPAPSGSKGFVPELRQYAKELVTGGPAVDQASEYLLREAKGFASGLNPVNAVKGAIRLTTDPQGAVEGMKQFGSDLVSGDPDAVGSALSIPVAGKALGNLRIGANRLGTALATSPNAQQAAGAVLGTVGGVGVMKEAGIASPFIGGMVGRQVMSKFPGPIIRVGRALEDVTGGRAAAVTTGGLTEAERAWALENGFTEEQISRMNPVDKAKPVQGAVGTTEPPKAPIKVPEESADPLTGETEAGWRDRVQAKVNAGLQRIAPSPSHPATTRIRIAAKPEDVAASASEKLKAAGVEPIGKGIPREHARLVLTPDEAIAAEQRTRAFRPSAREQGMKSAARRPVGLSAEELTELNIDPTVKQQLLDILKTR